MKTNRSLLVIAALTIAAGFAVADEPPTTAPATVDNPLFTAWSKFDVGTSVVHEGDIDLPNGGQMHIIGTDTLKEKTADAVKVEHAVQFGDRKIDPKVQDVPAKIDADQVKKSDDEDVKAMDKTFKCRMYEISYAAAGAEGDAADQKMTVDINDDIPGGVVKAVLHRPDGGDMTFLVTSVEKPEAK